MFRLDMPLLRSGGPHPTTTPIVAYDLISYCEAFYFGKEFLRMAGIVKMLHAQQPPNDKYSYAYPKRVRRSQQARTQARTLACMASAIPGSFRTRSWQFTYHKNPRVYSSPIWLILRILLNYKFRPLEHSSLARVSHSAYC